jgi:hypothetical protein
MANNVLGLVRAIGEHCLDRRFASQLRLEPINILRWREATRVVFLRDTWKQYGFW